MRITKKTVLSLLLAVTMIASAIFMASCRKKSAMPVDYLSNASENTIRSRAADTPFSVKSLDGASAFGIDFTYKATDDTAMIPVDELSIKSVIGKSAVSAAIAASISGTELALDLFQGEKAITFGSESLFGGTYGFNPKTAVDSYKNSIFAKEDGEYAVPESVILPILESLSGLDASTSGMKADVEKMVGGGSARVDR